MNYNVDMRRTTDGRFELQLERGVLTANLQFDKIASSFVFYPGIDATWYILAAFVVTFDVTTRFASWHSSCTEAFAQNTHKS